jgi:hypothetical protein
VAFFHSTALLGVPVLVLVWLAGRAQRTRAPAAAQASPSQ